jgi:hypothetical protein
VSLLTAFLPPDEITSIRLTVYYDEQFYSTNSKITQSEQTRSRKTSMISFDIKNTLSYNVYDVDRPLFLYLYVITQSGFEKCVGVGKMDNFVHQFITKKRKEDEKRKEEKKRKEREKRRKEKEIDDDDDDDNEESENDNEEIRKEGSYSILFFPVDHEVGTRTAIAETAINVSYYNEVGMKIISNI